MAHQGHGDQFHRTNHSKSQSHSKNVLPPVQAEGTGAQKQKHDQPNFHNACGLSSQQNGIRDALRISRLGVYRPNRQHYETYHGHAENYFGEPAQRRVRREHIGKYLPHHAKSQNNSYSLTYPEGVKINDLVLEDCITQGCPKQIQKHIGRENRISLPSSLSQQNKGEHGLQTNT